MYWADVISEKAKTLYAKKIEAKTPIIIRDAVSGESREIGGIQWAKEYHDHYGWLNMNDKVFEVGK